MDWRDFKCIFKNDQKQITLVLWYFWPDASFSLPRYYPEKHSDLFPVSRTQSHRRSFVAAGIRALYGRAADQRRAGSEKNGF